MSLRSRVCGAAGCASSFFGFQSACAHTLRELNLYKCSICAEGAKLLGLLIGQDSLPSLQELDIHGNRDLGIDRVRVLTQGLQASSLTKLTNLNFEYVGLDDEGSQDIDGSD